MQLRPKQCPSQDPFCFKVVGFVCVRHGALLLSLSNIRTTRGTLHQEQDFLVLISRCTSAITLLDFFLNALDSSLICF